MAPQHLTFLLLQLIIIAERGLSHILSGEEGKPHSIHKRNIVQMCDLIHIHTGRGCLDYNDYGCYCGLGNANSHPVDDVDNCCRIHDHCYGGVTCVWLYPQVVGYTTNCTTPPCSCTDSLLLRACAYTSCRCDVEFAECLANATYNETYKNYDRQLCSQTRSRGRNYYIGLRQKRSSRSHFLDMLWPADHETEN